MEEWEGGMVAPWRRCTAALARHAGFTFPTPSCLSSDAFDFAAFIHQCTRAMLTPHLSLPTLATEGPALHSAYPHLLLPSLPLLSLFCVTPCPSLKERKIDQEWKPGLGGEGERDCKWQRGEGEGEGIWKKESEEKKETLLANLCYRYASSFHCCSLSVKKRHSHGFFVDISSFFFFSPHFRGEHMCKTFTFNWLHTCTHFAKEWDIWWGRIKGDANFLRTQ